MSDIVWEDPPEPLRRGTFSDGALRNARILAELKQNPGRWALVDEDVSRALGTTWRKKGCEARTVPNGKGVAHRVKLYVRWPA